MLQHPSVRTLSFAAALLLTTGVAMINASAQDKDHTIVVELQADGHAAKSKPLAWTTAAPVSIYKIGVGAFPVEGALRAQLNLPKGQGLLIDGVVPNQPAAKAGIKNYDVILSLDGAKVGDLKALVAAIDKAKGSAIKLEVLRGGKKMTIAVTPAKRVPVQAYGVVEGRLAAGVAKEFWVQGYRQMVGSPIAVPSALHLYAMRAGTGVYFDRGTVKLPKHLSITITRSGEQPAKIVVKKSGQKWEVTDKELGKLPKDVRAHVEQILGHGWQHVAISKGASTAVEHMRSNRVLSVPLSDRVTAPLYWAAHAQHAQPVEKQLEQMRGEMREIRKALDELLKARRKPRNKNKKANSE